MKRKSRRNKGFTLLEVLLVLAILVILASTVTFYFANTQRKANTRAARIQIHAISQLLEEYHIDVGSYPQSSDGLQALMEAPASLADSTKWGGPYSKKQIPQDPWNREYVYESDGLSFTITSYGADGQEGTEDDVTDL
jgi:general secretion pathway protein G